MGVRREDAGPATEGAGPGHGGCELREGVGLGTALGSHSWLEKQERSSLVVKGSALCLLSISGSLKKKLTN